MTHAHVKIDGMAIPLIGIPQAATEETCTKCKKPTHLQEMWLDIDCRPFCRSCRISMARKGIQLTPAQ